MYGAFLRTFKYRISTYNLVTKMVKLIVERIKTVPKIRNRNATDIGGSNCICRKNTKNKITQKRIPIII